ncbi:MAG: HD domain-containing protein [Gemmatimonadetes bacterium]|nr:HD domain-containing protein [Gemmatimonadota bacterium]
MSDPVQFLMSLGHVLAAMSLYHKGHPARERAVDESYEELRALVDGEGVRQFTFVDREVVFHRQVLRDLKEWEWGTRLADVGIERVEIEESVTRDGYEEFLRDAFHRFKGESLDTTEARYLRHTGIRYGPILIGTEDDDQEELLGTRATIAYSLQDDIETVEWMHRQVQDDAELPLLEAEMVVRSLSTAMHGQDEIILPLLQLKAFDQYTTTHSTNVAVLAMALAEYIGLQGRDVRVMGVSGLLHDLGKVRIPKEILVKPGAFTDEERLVMQRHPGEGARIILGRDVRLEVPAIVAYEHHIMLNGGGYPAMHYARPTHIASRLVHVCDVYDALCTKRPYRDAWPSKKALALIEENTGDDFDPRFAVPFVNLMRQQEIQRVRFADPVVVA